MLKLLLTRLLLALLFAARSCAAPNGYSSGYDFLSAARPRFAAFHAMLPSVFYTKQPHFYLPKM